MTDDMKSLRLEQAARRALNLDSKGERMAGTIDADFINRRGAFTVLVAALSPYYKDASLELKQRIDQIVNSFYFLQDDISDDEYFEGVERATEVLNQFIREVNRQASE
jgi:acetolactate synthase small subunit